MENVRKFNTWDEMEKFVRAYNDEHGNEYNHVKSRLSITVVFSNDSNWKRHDYSKAERTYCFSNTDKFWYNCGGYSLFAYCVAEYGLVRLEQYYRDWIVEEITVREAIQ